MSREIKFRAWNIRLKKMMFVCMIDFVANMTIQSKEEPNVNSKKEICNFIGCKLIQFTGLKDKNGKEIYEGDIVQVDDEFDKTIHQVIWWGKYDYPAFDLDPDLDCECNSLQHCVCSGSTTMKIIGNIYENPELLERR